jgi:integrase
VLCHQHNPLKMRVLLFVHVGARLQVLVEDGHNMGTGVEWHGFHAFRRGLGTRLYNNGTPIETVAKVLRHGAGSEVTLKHYVEIEEETKAAALQSLPRKAKKAK